MVHTIWAKAGLPITIPCNLKVPSSNNYELEWRRDSVLLFNAYGEGSGYSIPEYQGRLARADNLGITIHAVTESDHATYQCSITNFVEGAKLSPEFGALTRLAVYAQPKIAKPRHGDITYGRKNDSLSLRCTASGIPPPEVMWVKDNKVISFNSTLTITRLDHTYAGEYTCHATNVEGTTYSTIVVLLANNITVKHELANKTVLEGSSVFWYCEAIGYPSNITYRWFKDEAPVLTLEMGLRTHIQGGEFGIGQVNKKDNGWYTCDANNGISPSAKSTAYLDVQYKPILSPSNSEFYTLALYQNATITCTVDANPPATFVQWIKETHIMSPTTSQTLFLPNVTFDDAGIYKCQAFNAIGSSKVFEIHVTVMEPPQFLIYPPPIVYAAAGGAPRGVIELECSGFGDPPPVQYWLRFNQRLSQGTLKLSNASHANHGLYQCILANSIGYDSRNVTVYVKDTIPQCPTQSTIDCDGETSLNIRFTPGYDGNSRQTFKLLWRQVNEFGSAILDEASWNELLLEGKSQIVFDTHLRFSFHELQLQATNAYGTAKCPLGIIHVCTCPKPPTQLTVSPDGMLSWRQSTDARSYVVSYKLESSNQFITLNETKNSHMPINFDKIRDNKSRGGAGISFVEFGVQSMRQPFSKCEMSRITWHFDEEQDFKSEFSFLAAFVLAVTLLLVLMFKIKKRKNKNKSHYMSPLKMPVSTYTDGIDDDILNGRGSSSYWHYRDNLTENNASDNDDNDNDSNMSVVNTMLREKYMQNPDYNQLNVLDELRLTQLKDELFAAGSSNRIDDYS